MTDGDGWPEAGDVRSKSDAMTFRLPPPLKLALKELRHIEREDSLNEFVIRLLQEGVERRQKRLEQKPAG